MIKILMHHHLHQKQLKLSKEYKGKITFPPPPPKIAAIAAKAPSAPEPTVEELQAAEALKLKKAGSSIFQ